LKPPTSHTGALSNRTEDRAVIQDLSPGLFPLYAGRMNCAFFKSPLGWLTLVSGPAGLRSLRFGRLEPGGMVENPDANRRVLRQLGEYFEGRRGEFDVGLDLVGTPFQLAVWNALRGIPYGETRSYSAIAREVGRPRAARAVGMANHENPIAIIVPCHRVIGSDGTLTGYAAGIDLKSRLLAFEGALAPEESRAAAPVRGRSTLPVPVLS